MKQETIEKAAKDYALQDIRTAGIYARAKLCEGFEIGAHWRINSVWHDMSEKPNGLLVILADLGDDMGQDEYSLGINLDGMENAKRWAYVADLLPNDNDANGG